MNAMVELKKCACGKVMETLAVGVAHCLNCDVPQPQEGFSLPRDITHEDVRYDMHWLRVITEEYENNTKKPYPMPGTAGDSPTEEAK